MKETVKLVDTLVPIFGVESYAHRSRSRIRVAVVGLGIMIFCLFGAMALVPIGGAVIASGQVAPESKVKQVAHLTGGVVSKIEVADGDHVRKGQVLVRLDASVSAISSELSSDSLNQLLARRARLIAEINEQAQVHFPADLLGRDGTSARDAMQVEVQRFHLNRAEQASQIGQVRGRISQLERQIDGYDVQIATLQQQQKLIEPELSGVRSLKSRGFVTIHQLNELERTAVQLAGSIGTLQAQIDQSRAAILQANEQRLQLQQSARTDASEELAKVELAINSQRIDRSAADFTFNKSVVRAPYSGVVDKLAVSAVGDIVRPSDNIMTIVPDSDRLVLEAVLSPTDIDRVRKGQAARIRLSAFSRTETPELNGTITFVSPATMVDARNENRFYRAMISLSSVDEARGRSLGLIAGMPVEIFILTGNRSMLSYITKPLRDQFSRAFRDE